MLHRTVLPPSETLDHALTEVMRLLPKRAKLERYKPDRPEMYILRRETLPDLSNFVSLLDEFNITDYEDRPAKPGALVQPLFPEIGTHHYVSFNFAPGTYHGTHLGWRMKGTSHRCVWCSAAEYATLFAQRRNEPGPWNISFYGHLRKGSIPPTVMPIATCYLPKEQVVEVEFDATARQATLYSVFPLNLPTPDSEPVEVGGCSPLDPFTVDWSFLQQVWQQKSDMEALIHAIRTDDRCDPLDDDRWEPEPKAQVAASEIADRLVEKLDPILAGRLAALSNAMWAGGIHDLCPELLPEPCLAMSLSPERVAELAFTLGAVDKAAIKQAFTQIEVDEDGWLGNAKDFLAYLTTWLKLLSRAKKKGHGVVVIFYG